MKTKLFFLMLFFILIILILGIAYFFIWFTSDNIYFHGDRNEKVIALTFDDGPSLETLQILEILKNENITATFFVNGENIEKNPEIFEQLIQSKNEIGNHGYKHIAMISLNKDKLIQNIKLNQEILNKYNISTNLFRPPYFFRNWILDFELKKLNNKMIIADVESKDYTPISVERIVENVLQKTKNGSIISLHDYSYGEERNIDEALKILIPKLKEQGYSFVNISTLLNLNDKIINN